MFGSTHESYKEHNVTTDTEIIHLQEKSNHLVKWMNAINSKDQNALKDSYDINAIKIVTVNHIINGAANIANSYTTQKNKIIAIESLYNVEANAQRGITYEIVKYTTDDQKEYIQLVIWKTKDEHVLREFEFTKVHHPTTSKNDVATMMKRRKLWMEFCNAHEVEDLVKQLYSANTMYYNHKPIIQGTENLIKEYGYMNNENYSLKLTPKKLEIVNANFAFEIGQCSGSYGGKYILIWKKETDGNWYIYIDSNI